MQKRALTDLNAPNGSRDISFQSQKFKQDGSRHFEGFEPHFHTKNDVKDANLQDNEKTKVRYLGILLLNVSEILQAVKTWQRNFA